MDYKNVLLIITDQQSGKALGCAGNPHLRTPALDSLAKSGIMFQNAYCCNPVCVPSRVGMFTGHYPHESGIFLNARHPTPELRRMPWLGRIFAGAGYETHYFGKWHLLIPPWQKWIHGFRDLEITTGRTKDERVAELCSRVFGQKHTKPFLVVASILNPHNVCQLARKEALPEADIGTPPPPEQCPPLPPNFAVPSDEPSAIREAYKASWKRYPTKNWTETDWRQYLWGYYRLVEHVDGIVGSILDALKASGHDQDTAVMFTSDHGEGMAEHGWNQKQVFYESVGKVPFIISAPDARHKGQIDDEILINNGVDMIPTLAELAGITLPGSVKHLPGRSIAGVLYGHDLATRNQHVVSESEFGGFVTKNWSHADRAYGRMVRTPCFKYVAYSRGHIREALIDILADPGEMVNLAVDSSYVEQLHEHRSLLQAWISQTKDDFQIPK
ncbi:MAG: sulfatase [Candidatus Sigynarchaeota archaeon]